jgi:hypothetical protein
VNWNFRQIALMPQRNSSLLSKVFGSF